MNIIVLSQGGAVKFECDHLWMCISIDNSNDHPVISDNNRVAILRCSFGDINQEEQSSYGRLFCEDDANNIWDFVEKNWNQVQTIMLHCIMGISRSAAIAASIDECLLGNRLSRFWKAPYYPNSFIHKIMRKTFNDRN